MALGIAKPSSQVPSYSGMFGTGTNTGLPTNKKSSSFKQAYPAAVEQTGEDYDTIMKGYQDILSKESPTSSFLQNAYMNKAQTPGIAYNSITPQNYNYQTSPDVTASLSKLGTLSDTGGYSGADIADLRARGVSPIRSVYANAMRNLDRQRSLQGGYGPNYAAVTSKLTRELADQIGSATQNVNAGIAENVAAGRRSMAPAYASAASTESGRTNEFGRANVDAANRANEFNAENKLNVDVANQNAQNAALEAIKNLDLAGSDTKFKALGGMQGLYGTTPALAATFGNQAAEAARLQEAANSRNASTGVNMISQLRNNSRPTGAVTRNTSSLPFRGPSGPSLNIPPWMVNPPSYNRSF